MKIVEHLNTRHKQYAVYDNFRSIANYIDGFKPSSRKIFYCINDFKNLNKVDTIANSTALKTQYLHGSTNLEGVTVGLSQTFAGTNLIPLFKTEGFFGTRTATSSGAPRYIKAKKNPVLDLIFRPEDTNVLIQQEFEGYKIEPQYYVPIIPMILINTQSGIGNGYSQSIYSRNPKEVIKYIKQWISKDITQELLPYFEGYKGQISKGENPNQYKVTGELKVINTTTIEITEIPINTSVEKYIKFLNQLEDNKTIKDYKDKSNKNEILFEIKVPRDLTSKNSIDELYKIFKLKSTITETLTVIGEKNQIVVPESIYDIIERFCNIRLEYYQKRKDYIIKQMEQDLIILQNKCNFIQAVNSGGIEIQNKRKTEIEFKLYDNYYDKVDDSYDYLLGMRIYTLTVEKKQELENQKQELENKLSEYKSKDITEIWLEELDELEKALPGYNKSTKTTKSTKNSTKTTKTTKEKKLKNPYKKINDLIDLF